MTLEIAPSGSSAARAVYVGSEPWRVLSHRIGAEAAAYDGSTAPALLTLDAFRAVAHKSRMVSARPHRPSISAERPLTRRERLQRRPSE